ncbi:MAG: type II toxin-antitoxin system VapC family toxin [Candidatus Margulisiibacteriota bacterium]
MNKKLRVYVDTSVFGGVFDPEFIEASTEFFKQINAGLFSLCISEVVAREIENAPKNVRDFFNNLLPLAENLSITKACIDLREEYIQKGIVTRKYLDDALHVATATISSCNIIVSWNFKHIVHFEKISLYNAINRINGYREIFINSPSEVINYED